MRLACLFLALSLTANAQWVPQHSGTDVTLRGLSVVSDQIVWASGAKGTYLRTTDGGAHWTAQQVPSAESLDFRDVEAFDTQHAILLSAGPAEKGQAKLYKTSDAGAHWKLVYKTQKPGAFLDCMAFWDHRRGIAVGDPIPDASGTPHFMVLLTNDGGEHWHEVPAPNLPPALKGEGAFAASGTCVAVDWVTPGPDTWFGTGGTAARVFHSADGGEHWTVAETPILHSEPSQGIFSVVFRGPKNGFALGGDYQKPDASPHNLATSNDGGATWKLDSAAPSVYLSGSCLPFVEGVIAVGSSASAAFGRGGWAATADGFNAIGCTGTHTTDMRGLTTIRQYFYAVGSGGKVARYNLDDVNDPFHKSFLAK